MMTFTPADRASKHSRELVNRLVDRAVQAIAIRALADQAVHAGRDLRVAKDRKARVAEVTREGKPCPCAVVIDVEHDNAAAEHVAGIQEGLLVGQDLRSRSLLG